MAAGTSSVEVAPTYVEEQSFVAFDHVAAGHEGVQSEASNGVLVIKPCTAAEIAFYESAAQHEAFQNHMPTLIGTLVPSNQNADDLDAISALEGHTLPANLENVAQSVRVPSNGASNALSQHSHRSTPSISQLSVSKRTSWQPSEGKKINTGLAIVLENTAHGFTHPNILDVKLGARLWADDAPTAKRQRLDDASRQTTSGSLGFRIAGMTVWTGAAEDGKPEESLERNFEVKNGYKRYDKPYGRSFSKDNVKNGFIEYFGGADAKGNLQSSYSRLVIKRIARELESIIQVLENEESRMYSASILMVYEGDGQALEKALEEERARNTGNQAQNSEAEPQSIAEDDEEDEDEPDPKIHDVRLIDFAHAQWTPGQGPDENALQGIRSVLKILIELAECNTG